MQNLVTDNATDPLKAVGFYYVEPIRIFDSMTVDFKAASPANVAQSCSLKYIDSILAEEICSCLSTTIADLSTAHVSSQVNDTTLKATRCFKLYLSTDKPVLGDPILQYLVLDKLSPKAVIGLDGMKRLSTEIVLDDKMMVQFKPPKLPELNIFQDYHGDLVAVLNDGKDIWSNQTYSTVCQFPNAAIDKLKNWQSVNSAPDYKMRVRELDDKDRDVPQQRYCFEFSIPMNENGKRTRQQQYNYSGAMIGKLKPEERESYKNEIDGYPRAGY
ncbi:hypothetical protein Pmar_PMAR011122 [Perkinsus marinus ATCC 50983]|uniref:Uncharacterized protein n=1 Tax=Perkinsus marinus (strain ATCC 50983 / TXsc) TaxID=423536 RepID=C5KVS1_PERM5|nr:hypothetical protein Pmar_PMAR011122 [Perkinsus marinus ATCC 50983]EER11456.1 hypothetical protein Pmar_PMAR011122 [Perkinsus marinus ATCC 50983]|eukprot:XP_002779661.1 hypothetical protein Pmar_PMAR011122 [Perkinsus marinus ATCC 50983]